MVEMRPINNGVSSTDSKKSEHTNEKPSTAGRSLIEYGRQDPVQIINEVLI